MDETDDNMSADDVSMVDSPSSVKVKPKKRSLVERELETSLTARITSPVTNGDTCSTSRYGRARRLKNDSEYTDSEKAIKQLKSPVCEKTPVKVQSPVYKMYASNSPIKTEPVETPKKVISTDSSLENQIENIYHENISLSRFGSDEKKSTSPGTKFPKVYVRKDLIQKREKEEEVVLIKNMFSPANSPYKTTNSHLNNILERSSEKYHLNTVSKNHNGYLNTASVVKTLDFDSNKKKKKENRDSKVVLSKSDLFEMEAKCEYQVGDLAWARMGTYPFWPCIVTREPSTGMFVKKKLFGRIERDVIHVTFFGDNGRRGWIVDTMLRKFLGQLEFEAARERFSPTAKKRDPRLYAAYFVSEKKMPQWSVSVEEAETLLREPKRLRIEILNEMLANYRLTKSASKAQKSSKITRTASDVSLSESLYDTLFSEDDGKTEDPEKSKSKTRKSLDVSEVVTACLDNMAAKTGITKIQRQSHMDRWLQKAKSKTPEKLNSKLTPQKKKDVKVISTKKKKVSPTVPLNKPYSFRKSVNESQHLKSHHNEHDYSTKVTSTPLKDNSDVADTSIGTIEKVDSISSKDNTEEEEVQLTNDDVNTTTASETLNSVDDVKLQENSIANPIISADDTVDEIQVNICSVEENAELEKCLYLEQKVEGEKINLKEPLKSKRNVSRRGLQTMTVNSEKHDMSTTVVPELENDIKKDLKHNIVTKDADSDKETKSMALKTRNSIRELPKRIPKDVPRANKVQTNSDKNKKRNVKKATTTETEKKTPTESDKDLNESVESLDLETDIFMKSTEGLLEFLNSQKDLEKTTPNRKVVLKRPAKRKFIVEEISDTQIEPKKRKKASQIELSTNGNVEHNQPKEDAANSQNVSDVIVQNIDKVLDETNNLETPSPNKSVPNMKLRLKRQTKSALSPDFHVYDSHVKSRKQKTPSRGREAKKKIESDNPPENTQIPNDIIKTEELVDSNKDLANSESTEPLETVSENQDVAKSPEKPGSGMKLRLKRHNKGQQVVSEVPKEANQTEPKEQESSMEVDLDKSKPDNIVMKSKSEETPPVNDATVLEHVDSNDLETISSKDTDKLVPNSEVDSKEQSNLTSPDKPVLGMKLRLNRRSKIPLVSSQIPIKSNHIVSKKQKKPSEMDKIDDSEQAMENNEVIQVIVVTEDVDSNELATITQDSIVESVKSPEVITDTKTKHDKSSPNKKIRLNRNTRAGVQKVSPIPLKTTLKDEPCLLDKSQEENTQPEGQKSIESAPSTSEEVIHSEEMNKSEIHQSSPSKPVITKKLRLKRTSRSTINDSEVQCKVDQIELKEDTILQEKTQQEVDCDMSIESVSTDTINILTSPQINSVEMSNTSPDNSTLIINADVVSDNQTNDSQIEAKSYKSVEPLSEPKESVEDLKRDKVVPNKLLENAQTCSPAILSEEKHSLDIPEKPDFDAKIVTEVQIDVINEDNSVILAIDEILMERSDVSEQAIENKEVPMETLQSEQDHSEKHEDVSNSENISINQIPRKSTDKSSQRKRLRLRRHTKSIETTPDSSSKDKQAECTIQDHLENSLEENETQNTELVSQSNESLETSPAVELAESIQLNTEASGLEKQEEINEETNENVITTMQPELIEHIENEEIVLPVPDETPHDIIETENDTVQDGNIDTVQVVPEPRLEESSSLREEEIEYGHLQFTEKGITQIATEEPQDKILQSTEMEQLQKQLKEKIDAERELEEKEYDHLDFIFSSYDANLLESNSYVAKDKNISKEIAADNPVVEKSVTNDINLEIFKSQTIEVNKIIDMPLNNSTDSENTINNRQRELRVSVEKIPLSRLPVNNYKDKVFIENVLDKEIKIGAESFTKSEATTSEPDDINKEANVEPLTTNGDNCSKLEEFCDDDLDERLILQDSFENGTSNGAESTPELNEADTTNVDSTNIIESSSDEVLTNPAVEVIEENEEENDKQCTEKSEDKVIEADSISKSDDSQSISTMSEKENSTEQSTKISECDTSSQDAINEYSDKETDSIGKSMNTETDTISTSMNLETDTISTSMDVDTFAPSINRLPEPVKLNGFHIDECIDFSDGEFNAETSSINSEDSEPLSVTRSKLLMKNRNKAKKALTDPAFIKYLELRQDELMDEHPELSQDEIVEYLFKTWQYEEDSKSDIVKNDDIEQSSLVKGLNQNLRQKTIRNHFRESKKRNKKRDEDTLSITSDVSDTSVKRSLRTRLPKSPAMSMEDSEDGSNKEMSLEIKTELLDNISINSDVSYNSVKYIAPEESKLPEPIEIESDEVSSSNTKEADDKTVSPDKITEEEKPKKHMSKEKSPKTKNSSIKSYFKVVSSNDTKTNQADEPETEDADIKIKKEYDPDTASINSEDSEVSLSKRKSRKHADKSNKSMNDPEFLKYVELRQDPLIDENPQLSQDEIISYLYKTWLYEESVKSDIKKTDDLEQASLVKGLNENTQPSQPKRIRKKVKLEKDYDLDEEMPPKDKPKRKVSQPYYNENLSDTEDDTELFDIFKSKKKHDMQTDGYDIKPGADEDQEVIEIDEVDEVELYFSQLTAPKPNVFKGLVREKVCDICEKTGNLVKCKGCSSMFHVDCVKKQAEVVEVPAAPTRGRKKKKKGPHRKPKSLEDSESHSDEKSQDVSEELNASIEEEPISRTVNADDFEAVLAAKMQELLPTVEANYDPYSSDESLIWTSTEPGKCEIVNVKIKPKITTDYSNFKCNHCQENSTPVCFVCKQALSKTGVDHRQKCQTAHCNKYYHLECLNHWPQTQFQSGEPSKNNKKISEHFEALMCPRHVCHTCVSDDPRGCRTRFSGDKLARCVRCPATYHTFTKCLPAGSQILTGSLIVCPRHYDHKPGKVPCHVNTGWCFICALGGSLICCEYCPTSFHAECLNIKPPEGGYMCEDCETGRLPLYGEMVWVKLGHYRWWPGIILHPSEIPENILAVKHSPGEFVVRFFGQYDHYWVNRGRVFPFQEGDSGKISSQKSKIDAAFTTAMEHAQRACEILKTASPNEEESIDIASSLLPPHYVKLRVNKPCGSLSHRRVDVEESSLTQCECDPKEDDPCGPYSHCLNRMLLTECGPICRAGERCSNRQFERRLYPRLQPYRTPHRGWGLKTLQDIRAGQFVIEYVGELIDEEEFRRRMARMHEVRDENFYFLTLDKERMIDAGPKGNLARFMNHCCEPNCETQKWTVLGDVRVGLFALVDIPANSELTFNYNLECAGIEKKRCMCGARRCAGYIGAKPKQLEDTQSKKNKLPGKRTYKKRKNVEESPSTSKNKPKRPVGRPAKPRELTEIEKDLLIIKNATNGLSSDSEGSGRLSSIDSERHPKALKRKRVSFSTEECKKIKVDEKIDIGH